MGTRRQNLKSLQGAFWVAVGNKASNLLAGQEAEPEPVSAL